MEVWKPIPGYEGLYEVSNAGRVRSLWFRYIAPARRRPTPLILKFNWNRKGYPLVGLHLNNKARKIPVSRLVLSAFVGPCPPGMEAAHLDGVRGHNAVDNLRWVTHLENMGHQRAHGTAQIGDQHHARTKPWTICRGDRHGRRKLSSVDVAEIRRRRALGERVWALAEEFKITPGHVGSIVRGDCW